MAQMRRGADHDARNVYTVIVLLGGIAGILCVGILVLQALGKTVDAGLLTLAGTTIGSLGAMLSRTSTQPDNRGVSGREIGEGIQQASEDKPIVTEEVTKVDTVPYGNAPKVKEVKSDE